MSQDDHVPSGAQHLRKLNIARTRLRGSRRREQKNDGSE
jgi:hypothetical protein